MSAALIPLVGGQSRRLTRAVEIFDSYLRADSAHNDRMFAGLLAVQWFVGVSLALWLTPLTWVGTEYRVHVHVWTALLMGGAITLWPIYLVYALPGQFLTRMVIAVAQMLWSALLVHLTGGRIETHFHAFGSLAFLAFYRDWRVIAVASLVIAGDHIFRGVFWPMSVFGVSQPSLGRALEHGGWILYEDFFLLLSIRQRRNELRVIADREAWYEEAQRWTEDEIARRTRQLVNKQGELQAIMDASPLGKFMTDPHGTCIYVNPMCCEITGLTRQQCLGNGWASNVHPEDIQEMMQAWGAAFEQRCRLSRPHRIIRHDGKVAWVNVTSAPIYHGKESMGFVGSLEEITKRIEAEQELRRAKEAAQAANQAKSSFLANMSHELRTPMTAILGFVDVLIGELEEPENLQAAQTVKRNAEYLLRLINDILDLSKIESGKLEAESLAISPRELLQDVVALMQVRATAKSLRLELELSGELPTTIRTDPLRLRQVLVNLIGNAIKFSEVGEVRVITRLEESDAVSSILRIEVQDSGVGLSPEQLGKLFEPFTQADSSTTRRYGGTGLGLTISKRLIELLGGTIEVRSEVGVGSTFAIALPVEALPAATATEPYHLADQGVPASESEVPPDCSQLHVLLAEDGPDNQRLIAFLLRKAGAQVTVVEHGQAAVDAVRELQALGQSHDVILMDMQMPVMDGYTATRILREQGCGRPIIALTAHAMSGDREKCLAAGCNEYATKPIDRQRLLSLIAACTRQSAQV